LIKYDFRNQGCAVFLQEKEFFATRDREIAEAPNKAAREKLIKELPQKNLALAQQFEETKHHSEAESKFIRYSGNYPLTGQGDVNTYAVFTETARHLLNLQGRAGIIVPSGIATDDTTSDFFADMVRKRSLVSLLSFENEEFIFPGIHHSTKFCLLTVSSGVKENSSLDFMFFTRRTGDLKEDARHFTLTSDEFTLLNPNTLTCPIFRTRKTAESIWSLENGNIPNFTAQKIKGLTKSENRIIGRRFSIATGFLLIKMK